MSAVCTVPSTRYCTLGKHDHTGPSWKVKIVIGTFYFAIHDTEKPCWSLLFHINMHCDTLGCIVYTILVEVSSSHCLFLGHFRASSAVGCWRAPERRPLTRLPVAGERRMSGTPSSAAAGTIISVFRIRDILIRIHGLRIPGSGSGTGSCSSR